MDCCWTKATIVTGLLAKVIMVFNKLTLKGGAAIGHQGRGGCAKEFLTNLSALKPDRSSSPDADTQALCVLIAQPCFLNTQQGRNNGSWVNTRVRCLQGLYCQNMKGKLSGEPSEHTELPASPGEAAVDLIMPLLSEENFDS